MKITLSLSEVTLLAQHNPKLAVFLEKIKESEGEFILTSNAKGTGEGERLRKAVLSTIEALRWADSHDLAVIHNIPELQMIFHLKILFGERRIEQTLIEINEQTVSFYHLPKEELMVEVIQILKTKENKNNAS